MLRKVDLIDVCWCKVEVDNLHVSMIHEKRWLFNNIVAHVDDNIRSVNGAVQVVVI